MNLNRVRILYRNKQGNLECPYDNNKVAQQRHLQFAGPLKLNNPNWQDITSTIRTEDKLVHVIHDIFPVPGDTLTMLITRPNSADLTDSHNQYTLVIVPQNTKPKRQGSIEIQMHSGKPWFYIEVRNKKTEAITTIADFRIAEFVSFPKTETA